MLTSKFTKAKCSAYLVQTVREKQLCSGLWRCFKKRPAKKLSGGEQQRVALARALVLDTEVLLLDEPTANIDPKNIAIIEETLSWLNKEKKTTIVIATHNMFQAETLASRAAL